MIELATAIAAPVLVALIIVIGRWFFKKAVDDLRQVKNQVQPNGGGSLFDMVKESRDLSQKAVDLSLATDAKMRALETKLDAFILSRLP